MNKENERSLFLVRHLATRFNRSGLIMGRSIDAGILEKEKGYFLDRVERFGELYEPKSPIYVSSPMRRCRQTAALLNEKFGGKYLTIEERFIETDMGEFSGKKGINLRKEYGDLVDEWMYSPETFCFPQGECYSDMRRRVKEGLKVQLKNLPERSDLVLVSHVDIIKVILSDVLGFSFDNRRYISIPTGSISVVGVLANQKLRVERINAF